MGSIRVILYNADPAYGKELREALFAYPQLKIVAEIDDLCLLPQAVQQFAADLLLAHLDPMAMMALEVLGQVAEAKPRLPIFAVSANTDGDVLLRAMRSGLKRFLVKPLKPDELEEALKTIEVDKAGEKQPGKLVSVMGSAGGIGATFVSTNLAVELAQVVGHGQRVALLDFDFRFGQVATLLDLEPTFTVADLCATPEELDPAMVEKALVKHPTGVHVLARPHEFAHAESITAAHAAAVISVLLDTYAYVVIDGPMRHDPGGRPLLDAADYNFMIVQLLVTSVRNADRMVKELEVAGFNPSRFMYVCNRVGRESSHLELDQVERTLNAKVYHQLPDDWRAASSSINVGHPLIRDFDRSRIRLALRELALKIHCPEALAREAKGPQPLLQKLIRSVARTEDAPAGKNRAAAPAAAQAALGSA